MDFRERLQKATERGSRARSQREQKEAAEALSEEEYRRQHSNVRLELTDHIEKCLRQLADNFPGFEYQTMVDDNGWGGSISRDDLVIHRGVRDNAYSRLRVLVSPANSYRVLEITARGAVRNKENFERRFHEKLEQADVDNFRQYIERWILEYAELYAAG